MTVFSVENPVRTVWKNFGKVGKVFLRIKLFLYRFHFSPEIIGSLHFFLNFLTRFHNRAVVFAENCSYLLKSHVKKVAHKVRADVAGVLN